MSTVLSGARFREGLTQAQLATMIGAKPSHISEMEHGKRPIGKEIAKRLGKALNSSTLDTKHSCKAQRNRRNLQAADIVRLVRLFG
ncbi:MAG: helix-turn-helix domain-containing protein [Proteobacteria bacterium]|nr:helix-turn-helix domain-containing protein [Pseudomonadota bacterium]MBU4356042.1 helix-turn-helix domain-containing protein [Pseudomonadota bacterium]